MVSQGAFDPSRNITGEVALNDIVKDGFDALLENKDNVKIIMTNP